MRINRLVSLLALAGLTATASATITIGPTNTAFVDISATGTSVGSISDDSENLITAAQLTGAGFGGNGLLAGGVGVVVGNNGGVVWNGTTEQVGYINRTDFATMAAGNLGDTGNGNGNRQFVAALWDDNFPGTGASTKWQVVGGNLVIQWTNQDHFNAQGSGVVTYEMIVYGGVSIASGNALVDFVYNDTSYQPNQYQNDGGSATIGYKNWGVNADGNDVEFGQGGGNNTINDPAFGDASMRPKVAGYLAADNASLTHAVRIQGVPTPGALALLGLGGLVMGRRRRA